MTQYPNHNINYLIALYLNNELSGEEKEFVQHWCEKHPKEYEFLRATFENKPAPLKIDTDKAWADVSSRMAGRRVKRHRFYYVTSIAATILLLAGLFVFLQPRGKSDNELTASLEGSFVTMDKRLECTLPDGSRVLLQKNSRLSYNYHDAKIRKTALEGEAYFDVKHNKDRVFSVATSKQEISVLGTSFVINTHQENTGETVWVHTGKVRVRNMDNDQTVVLDKNESSVLVNNHLQKAPVTDQNNYAWATKELIFENKPLVEVVKTIEQTFDTPIVLDSKISDYRVTASYKNEKLEDVLRELSVITGLQYEKAKNGYLIKKKE